MFPLKTRREGSARRGEQESKDGDFSNSDPFLIKRTTDQQIIRKYAMLASADFIRCPINLNNRYDEKILPRKMFEKKNERNNIQIHKKKETKNNKNCPINKNQQLIINENEKINNCTKKSFYSKSL